MATVLLAWELGGGLGHVAQFAPLTRKLRFSGQRIYVALRELPRSANLFDGTGVALLQSPYKPAVARGPVATPRNFAHILWNAGFGDTAELEVLTQAWENLFDLVAPDLVVFDHAPTALLAARGRTIKRVVIGNGFCCPPDCSPLPDLRPWMTPEPEQLRQAEQFVLDCANTVLQRRGVTPLDRITQLYGEVDEQFLTTFAEFDHYPDRKGGCYRGPWSVGGGASPVWPAGKGKRVYAYLSPFPGLPGLLEALRGTGCPTILYGPGLDPRLQQRFAAPTLHFETRRLDLTQVAQQCDVAVLNGGQATTLTMLLAGKPVLQVPIFLEQGLNALATVRLGAGLSTFPEGAGNVESQLRELLVCPKYTEAACAFATKYAGFYLQGQIDASIQHIEQLLAKAI